MDLSDLRRDFGKFGLNEDSLADNPMAVLKDWITEVQHAGVSEPNAMVLSTVDIKGRPSSRVVLLKEISHEGLIFYTNYQSRKGKDLRTNPNVCLNFFWRELEKQIRVEGTIIKTSREASEQYFKSRPLESKLSAIISPQSEEIDDLSVLKRKTEELFVSGKKIVLPEFWGGYMVKPSVFEFWQGGKNRLHDRIRYKLKGKNWMKARLAP